MTPQPSAGDARTTDAQEEQADTRVDEGQPQAGRPAGSTAASAPVDRFAAWCIARHSRLVVWRRLSEFKCEYFEPAEWDTGWSGVPRCYQSGLVNQGDTWCDQCKARDLVFADMLSLKRAERVAYRSMCRSAESYIRRVEQAVSKDSAAQALGSDSVGGRVENKENTDFAPPRPQE